MTTYIQHLVKPIFPPFAATIITFAMLYLMYALIAYEGEPPTNTLTSVRIPDFVQDPVEPPVDTPPPEKIADSELPPDLPPVDSTIEGGEIVGEQIDITDPGDDFTIDFTSADTPIATMRVQPQYPSVAAQRGIEGWVILSFDVTRTGATDNVRVIESEPGTTFDRAAVRAVAKWKYLPKTIEGEAVRVNNIETKLVFELED